MGDDLLETPCGDQVVHVGWAEGMAAEMAEHLSHRTIVGDRVGNRLDADKAVATVRVIGERIRDKFAASRRKGMWMGGNVPLGYRVEARKLVVVEPEAELVRTIFTGFAAPGSALRAGRDLIAAGEVTKRWNANSSLQGGRAWTKGDIYKILANRVRLSRAMHKGVDYPGEHAAIVDQEPWDRAHGVMAEPTRQRAATSGARVPMLLKGLIFGPNGRPMSPSHTTRRGRQPTADPAILGHHATECP